MKPVLLIVLDGYGLAPAGPGNAIELAQPQNINGFFHSYPNTVLKASGEAVGLPSGEPGNTEVGHINIGAGRVIYQDLPRINMSIADGSFYSRPAFLKAIDHVKHTNGKLHLIGLVGQGTVHSQIDHLLALLYLAREQKLTQVYIHAITDGRDSPPKSSIESLNFLEEKFQELKIGKIATIMGRYWGMDRDRRWERTQKAYDCLTKGSENMFITVKDAVENSYSQGKTDEFIEPLNISVAGKPAALIEKGDSVIFFNYRIDRPRQITKAFVQDDFENQANKNLSYDPYEVKYLKSHISHEQILSPPFNRGPKIEDLVFVTMTEYEKNLPVEIAYPPIKVKEPLGKILSQYEIPQLRATESEKERFVTFYFDGQEETIFPLEDRIIIPSPKVATYDLKPEMSSTELTEVLIEKINQKKYQFIIVNYPNADMVGHTGNIQASVLAIKAIDSCLGRLIQTALSKDYCILITADHGNAEEKINPHSGEISTEHTSNLVPFIAISNDLKGKNIRLQSGILGDIAPTVLSLLGLPQPPSMTGRNLLEDVMK